MLRPQSCLSKFSQQHKVLSDALQDHNDIEKLIYRHQKEAVLALKEELENPNDSSNNGISLAVLPTGSGKTGIAVLAAYCCGQNKQVLVVTPSEIISRQQYNDFFSDSDRPTFLEDRRLFSREDRKNYMPNAKLITKTDQLQPAFESMELIVVNAHKLGTKSNVKLEDIPVESDVLVIVDEAHHYPAVTWKNIVAHFKGCRIIFLTATPYNKGKYILGNKKPCYELSRADAIERGIIRDACFIEVPEEATTNEHLETLVKEKNREYFDSVSANEKIFHRVIEVLVRPLLL